MKFKAILAIAAVVGAMAASAGVLGVFNPLGDAEATSTSYGAPPEMISGLLDEMAPGAIASKQADGSISISGPLTPSEQAEIQRAKELAEANPTIVRCDGTGATLTCAPVPDSEVTAALKAADGVYGRVIYRSLTKEVTDRAAPMFEAGELVCSDPKPDGTMPCTRADRVQPVIPFGETLFVTYKPYSVTFDEQGFPTIHLTGNPEVRLVRAAP